LSPLWIPLSSVCWAFAPIDAPTPGGEVPLGLEPQRIFLTHPAEQGRLLGSEAWRAFASSDGAGWSARFDESTGSVRYLWGRGIPMPATGPEIADAVAAIIERHPDLFGVPAGSLRLRSARHVPRTDTWYVDLDALRDGLPTWRGGVSARVKHGNLVQLTVGTAPRAAVTGRYALSASSAIQRAIVGGPAPRALHTQATAEQILLERAYGSELRKTWLVRTATAEPPGLWVTFVDGETGAVLSVHDEVRYASGTISGRHHERTLDGSALVTSPMPLVTVSGSSDSGVTDDNGEYTLNGNGPFSTDLDGGYVDVRNSAGGEGSLSGSSPDLTWDSGDATQAEIDSYVFLNQVLEWGQRTAPEVAWVQGPIVSNVNLNSVCNAYFDGAVNFFSAGSGCNNTGQIADVNFHEWGHGFHYYSIEAGFFDGSLSEGAGDTVSFLLTDDRYIAPYFGTSGWAIRDVGPDQVYPQDFVNSSNYVHTNGLIFGGAFWDLLDLLQDSEGEEAGNASTSQIFAGTLKGGTDIPGSFYEALVADDDDGDLENGTPHVCEIYDAFGRHGLGGSLGIDAVLVAHDPLVTVDADEDAELDLELLSVSAGCTTVGAGDARVHWRVDGGAWDDAALDTPGQRVEGTIPGQPAHSFVEYYVTGTASDGTPFSAPTAERQNPYTYYVGGTLEVRCDDFEADDGGYTHELLSGSPDDGADDWQWGTPTGQGGDPAGAYSGTHAWGNDLGLEGFNGLYQADKTNRLRSPRVDTAHYTGVFLQYRRWLRVQDGDLDQAVITVDDQEMWNNWKGPASSDDHHLDSSWLSHSLSLEGFADQTTFRLGFEIRTNGRDEFGGWNIDDVCILAPDTPDNRLGITDFAAEAVESTVVSLSWTNPAHRPLERVRVVRKLGDFPTGFDDGEVAEEVEDPVVGEEVEVRDVNGRPGTTYYAVYGFDGDDWLSWTIDGWNAAAVDVVGGPVGPEDQWDTGGGDDGTSALGACGGCGCDGTGSGGLGAVAVWGIAGAVALRRRRTVSPKVRE
jgi:hypothetical protein